MEEKIQGYTQKTDPISAFFAWIFVAFGVLTGGAGVILFASYGDNEGWIFACIGALELYLVYRVYSSEKRAMKKELKRQKAAVNEKEKTLKRLKKSVKTFEEFCAERKI